MTRKEVEKLLSVSPSEIRLLRKKGLLNYDWKGRDYTEEDVAALKKILVLRKLGFTVEEIAAMQKGELSFSEAAKENISRTENEIDTLENTFPELVNNTATRAGRDVFVQKAAMDIIRSLLAENISFDELDAETLWTRLAESEQSSLETANDYSAFGAAARSLVGKAFFNFKGLRKEYGVLGACGFILAVFLVGVLVRVVILKEPFGEVFGDFVTQMIVLAVAMVLVFFLFLLGKKAPKAASVIAAVLLILCFSFLSLIVLLLLYGFIRLLLP